MRSDGAFTDANGRRATRGDEVEYRIGQRRGILGEVMQGGEADVTWLDDGSYGCVNWHHLCKVPDEFKTPRP